MSESSWQGPLPEPTLDSQPFWDGLREHRLVLQCCLECHQVRHYPRPVCDRCHSMECDWVEASGRGKVHSWTVSHHPFHPAFKELVPYVLVTVDLDAGVRMQSRLIDAEGVELEIGVLVELAFQEVCEGITLPLFRPLA